MIVLSYRFINNFTEYGKRKLNSAYFLIALFEKNEPKFYFRLIFLLNLFADGFFEADT